MADSPSYPQVFRAVRELLDDPERPEKYLVLYPNADGGWTATLETSSAPTRRLEGLKHMGHLIEWCQGSSVISAVRRLALLRSDRTAAFPRWTGADRDGG